MDVLSAIEMRASAVKLAAPGPSPEHLQRILNAGSRAPDHGRLSPWRFVVVEGEARQKLGELIASVRKREYPEATAEDLQRERDKALRAPTIVVVAGRITQGGKIPEIEQVLAVGAATQNMILAAQALGYGAMWKTGSAAYDAGVKTALGLAPADHIAAFLYLGTTIVEGRPRVINATDYTARF